MTKQEIKDAIQKGIAGQGTNVDGGGYLPKILDAIVDLIPEGGGNEPLIVKGSVADDEFQATDGTTLQQAADAFLSGRLVILQYIDTDNPDNSGSVIVTKYVNADVIIETASAITWG